MDKCPFCDELDCGFAPDHSDDYSLKLMPAVAKALASMDPRDLELQGFIPTQAEIDAPA